jgi:hypothetical protein
MVPRLARRRRDDRPKMSGVALEFQADFSGATFGFEANFASAIFHIPTGFTGATFGDRASFKGTVFKGPVTFTGKSKEESIRRLEVDEHGIRNASGVALAGRHDALWRGLGSGPNCFVAISFERARFDKKADFSGRTFEGDADFTKARFYCPPDFDAETKLARIDFTGAYIGFSRRGRPNWTFQSRVAIQLRALRNIAEDTKNHDLERDLYIEERKAERGVYLAQRFLDWVRDPRRKWALIAHLLWILVMGVYWALADYGRSFARPFVWLFASVYFFYWRYTEVLAPLMPKTGPLDTAKYERAVDMLVLGNAVPFVGPLTIDGEVKKFLFCPGGAANCLPPIPPEGFQFLVIAQNLVSITVKLPPEMRISLSSRLTSPLVFDRMQNSQALHVDATAGGGCSFAISRRMLSNKFLGTATSAIWNAT